MLFPYIVEFGFGSKKKLDIYLFSTQADFRTKCFIVILTGIELRQSKFKTSSSKAYQMTLL
jgi:hypothetical protein